MKSLVWAALVLGVFFPAVMLLASKPTEAEMTAGNDEDYNFKNFGEIYEAWALGDVGSLATADFDGDGDQDLAMVVDGTKLYILRNDLPQQNR